MATYQVLLNNAVQGAQSSVSVTPNVPPLSGVTTGTTSTYFYAGDQATDTQLGGAPAVSILLAAKAIVQVS